MDVQELNKQYGAKINEAKALAGGEVTEEVATKIDELLGQADEIKGRIALAERLQAGEAFLAEPAGTKAAQAGWTQVEVTKDEADQPWESAGEFFKAVKNAAYHPSQEDRRLRAVKATGLSEGVPADGGYL